MRRILFDHCVPKPLRRHLPAFEIRTCFEEGWSTVRNGELLIKAEAAGFNILVTADQNLSYQQNLAERRIAILELPLSWRGTLKMLPASTTEGRTRIFS